MAGGPGRPLPFLPMNEYTVPAAEEKIRGACTASVPAVYELQYSSSASLASCKDLLQTVLQYSRPGQTCLQVST